MINLCQVKIFNRCKYLIILLIGQINFIRDLIGEKLSLEAQFELNWEYWNSRGPNLIFTESVDWNYGINYKKIKV